MKVELKLKTLAVPAEIIVEKISISVPLHRDVPPYLKLRISALDEQQIEEYAEECKKAIIEKWRDETQAERSDMGFNR